MRNATSFLVAAALLVAPAAGAADKAADGGKFEAQFRLRAETVDDSAFARDANGTTLRTRLAWTSAARADWRLVVEVDDVRALDQDRSFSTTLSCEYQKSTCSKSTRPSMGGRSIAPSLSTMSDFVSMISKTRSEAARQRPIQSHIRVTIWSGP